METRAKVDQVLPTQVIPPESLLPAEREQVLLGLAGRVHQSLGSAEQNLGHLEAELLRGSHELFLQTGDEGLMSVETFWRNNRWHLLFPHVQLSDPSKN